MSYVESALKILKHKGYRITKPRKLVLELLNQTDNALSAYEIRDLLNDSGEPIDTVSVYRILDCLEENHLIHRVLLTGKVRKCQLEQEDDCHLPQSDHCHHLLLCRVCGSVEEIHCLGLDDLVREVSQQTDFQVDHHHLEFMGRCRRCQ